MFDLIKKVDNRYKLLNSRFERKIKINKNNLIFYKNFFLKSCFTKQYPDQIIESVYFDDSDLNFAKSNINGEFYRIKPRIRWYNNNFKKIACEFKIKKGFNGFKVNTKELYSQNDTESTIIKKTKLFLQDLLKISLNEIIHIKYRRSYLKHPSGVRLTLDRNLSYKLSNTNINKSLDFEVLEFKYDYFKDNYFRNYIFSGFSKMPIRLTKCSKYVEAITKEYS